MAAKYIVDTHALIWYLESNPKLGNDAKAILDDPSSEMVLPVIALAEAAYIVDKGRTKIPDVSELFSDVASDPRVELYPLDFGILQASLKAAAIPEMHDRLIVATGLFLLDRGEAVSILTKDETITASGLLSVIW